MSNLFHRYHIYETEQPIDSGWDRLHTLINGLPVTIARAAMDLGWEGNFRKVGSDSRMATPCVGWHPIVCQDEFLPCFVWKQDNNGTTFMATPIRLAVPIQASTDNRTCMVPYEEIEEYK